MLKTHGRPKTEHPEKKKDSNENLPSEKEWL